MKGCCCDQMKSYCCDKSCKQEIIVNTACVETLSKFICYNFDEGDIIGLTFVGEGVASIAIGVFVKIFDGVVVVRDLFIEDTTSFIPLCDVSSVEKGIIPVEGSNKAISVNLR